MKNISPVLSVYFILLALAAVAVFVMVFPFQLDEYQGHTISGTMGLIGVLIPYLAACIVLLVNLISSLVFLVRRKHRLISSAILAVSCLALFWPYVVGEVLPYETIALHHARELIRSGDFRSLNELYGSRLHAVPVSVLPQSEYFVIGDYVINFKKNTYGRLKTGIGFFEDYYESGDQMAFTNLDSLIRSLPYHVDRSDVVAIYDLMRRLQLSDVSFDKATQSTIFAWEQSAAAGSRGVIVNATSDRSSLRSDLESEVKFERWEAISPGMYYFRISSRSF